MIEFGYLIVGAGILAMALVAGLLARRPAHTPVTILKRNKKQ
jgi:hypothetical protein